MYPFKQFLDQLPTLLNQVSVLIILISAIGGLALTYAGLKIYWLGIFLAGMPVGLIIGGGIAVAADWGAVGAVVLALLGGFFTGVLAVALTKLGIFLAGMLIAGLLTVIAGSNEPFVIFILAVVGGLVALVLYDWAIVLGTAATGALMMLFVCLNVFSMLSHGRPAVMPGDFITYLLHLGQRAYQGGASHGLTRAFLTDVLIFAFFFITGVFVQLNLFKHLLSGRADKSARHLPPSEESKSPALLPANGAASGTVPAPVAARGADGGKWRVSVYVNSDPYQARVLDRGSLTIGRGAGADIRVPDEMVSDMHLEIVVAGDGGLSVQDLGTPNGTWKQGRAMIQQDWPRDRDWYQMGRVQVVCEALPPQITGRPLIRVAAAATGVPLCRPAKSQWPFKQRGRQAHDRRFREKVRSIG